MGRNSDLVGSLRRSASQIGQQYRKSRKDIHRSGAIVGKALGPALRILVPVFVDALRKHGPAAIESMVQSWIAAPRRRAWRTYAAAALAGLAASPNTDRTTGLPALADQAAAIADEMVKREAEPESEDDEDAAELDQPHDMDRG